MDPTTYLVALFSVRIVIRNPLHPVQRTVIVNYEENESKISAKHLNYLSLVQDYASCFVSYIVSLVLWLLFYNCCKFYVHLVVFTPRTSSCSHEVQSVECPSAF